MTKISPWLISSFANICIGLMSIVTSTLLSRTLGPTGRGILAEAMLWPGLVLAAGAIVNTENVTYFWAKARRDASTHLTLGASLSLVAGLSVFLLPCAWFVNYVTLGWQSKSSYTLANLYTVAVPMTLFLGCAQGILLAEERFHRYWGTRLSYVTVYLAGLSLLALAGQLTPFKSLIVVLIALLVQTILTFYSCLEYFIARISWDRKTFRAMAVYGTQSNLTGLPYHGNVMLDQMLMSLLLSSSVLGYYATAVAWSSILSVLGGGLSMVMLSRSSSTNIADKGELTSLFARYRTISVILVAMGILAASITPIGMPLLFGNEFLPAVLPAMILCLASSILNMNLILHELARGLGHPGFGIVAELVGLFFTTILLVICLPLWGGVGAAIASLLSYSCVLLSLLFLVSKRLGVNIYDCVIPRKSDFDLLRTQVFDIIHLWQSSS
jgi:O-antigen/teichoic acid export membrane protein